MNLRSTKTWKTLVVVLAMVAIACVPQRATADDNFSWEDEWMWVGPDDFFDGFRGDYQDAMTRVVLVADSVGGGVISNAGNFIELEWPNSLANGDSFAYAFNTPGAPVIFIGGTLIKNGPVVATIEPNGVAIDNNNQIVGFFVRTHTRKVVDPVLPTIPPNVPNKIVDELVKWARTLGSAVPDGANDAAGNWGNASNAMRDLYWKPDEPANGDGGATLLPTVASKSDLYLNTAGTNVCDPASAIIHDYFNCKFLPNYPVMERIIKWHFAVSPTLVSVQGLYDFRYKKTNTLIHARFTYVFEKRTVNGEAIWKIIQHHSSKDPAIVPPPPPNREQNIKDLLRPENPGSWGWTLNQPNVTAANMDALYAADAELLPTVKKGVWLKNCGLHGGAKIATYFSDAFLSKEPKLIAIDHQKIFISPDQKLAVNQGLYTFQLNKLGLALPPPYPANTQPHVKARFTFVYRKGAQDNWSDAKIILHHSSAVPSCPGDLIGGPFGVPDGTVNWDDLNELLRHWGVCQPQVAPLDCKNDREDVLNIGAAQ